MNALTYCDSHAEYYRKLAKEGRLENVKLLDLLLNQLRERPELLSVCDLGCAAGSLYQILHDLGPSAICYEGFDVSENVLREAHHLFPHGSFRYLDIRASDLPHDFDVVFSSEMLSHIELKHHESVIRKILNHASRYALFSMKYCEDAGFEHRYNSTFYVYPNLQTQVQMVKSLTNEHMRFHREKMKWEFLADSPNYEKVGNLSVEVIKENVRT